MSESILLALDVGAESGRVMAAAWDGRRISLEEMHRFANGPVAIADTLRWDVTRLWQSLEDGLALAARKYSRRIASVGVDTWGLDYVLLSRTDELLGLPYCYRDARTRGGVEKLCQRVPRPEVFAATGSQFLEINTLCQWLAHHEAHPEMLAAADRMLLMPDWLNWCLSGSRVAEFTNATTTQCLHPSTREWSSDLLRRLDLPTQFLPELVQPGTRLGPLRKAVGERTGLAAIDVIAPATHDTASAVVAVPTCRTGHSDWAYISSGTWSLVGVESPVPLLSPSALAHNVTNEGGVDGTWRVLKNVMGLWLIQRCRQRFAESGGTSDYATLTTLAAAEPGGRFWVDPDDPRFLNPRDMPAAIQSYCQETGQPRPETEAALIRCALESLALKYATVLDQLEGLTGDRIEIIHIVGGGRRNQLLNQLTANATGRPVIAGPVEATALGNSLIQLRTRGELSSLKEIREAVLASEQLQTFEPQPDRQGHWASARDRFRQRIGGQQ